MTKPVSFRPSYAAASHATINGYSDEGHELKQVFLRDAARYLRAAAKVLAEHGLSESNIRINRAGIAVSGEVYADFCQPGESAGVWVEVSGSALRGSGYGRPSDGLCILVQTREWEGTGKKRRTLSMGVNHWLSAELTSEELAYELLRIGGYLASVSQPAPM